MANYSKPTCGWAHFHFVYPWFKTYLILTLLTFHNPPLHLPLEKTHFQEKKKIYIYNKNKKASVLN